MINVVIYTTPEGRPCGFLSENHGNDIVCAAVSILCQNTVNSLEALTGAALEYGYDELGGYMECLLPGLFTGEADADAALLLDALVLGLGSVSEVYSGDITLDTRVWHGGGLEKRRGCIEFKR